MPKLNLAAAPTFSADVPIPRPGEDPVDVKFTFKHRDRKALDKWIDEDLIRNAESESDPIELDLLMVKDVAIGWELSDEFNDENIRQLLLSYGGSAVAIFQTYVKQLRVGKQKN